MAGQPCDLTRWSDRSRRGPRVAKVRTNFVSMIGGCMRALAVTAGICAVLAVAGCSKTTQSDTPTAASQTTLSRDQLWDPCTLPDSAIAATGADPSTKDDNPGAAHFPRWRGCRWHTSSYFLTIGSASSTMAEIHANSSFTNLKDVNVPGRRSAVSYNEGVATDCYVDFPTSKGIADVSISKYPDVATSEDPCALAVRAASTLNSSIPK